MWTLSPDIVASKLYGKDPLAQMRGSRTKNPNPLVGQYKTKDGRFLSLMMLQADKHWAEACERLGLSHIIDDPRFSSGLARYENREECIRLFDEAIGSRTLDEWREAFRGMKGVWAPVQTALELYDDPQVAPNGYIVDVDRDDGVSFPLVASPVMFDEETYQLSAAPEHGQHTEELMLELGYSWEDIAAHKESGAIL
jgi:crotonobetainyl-CoA:carnitine CoA-transferase CaiB-like acyl-CoA transferase